MNGFHDCCHCRKLSARREYKGKSDENADSITVPAVHGGPYMQVMQTFQPDGLSPRWVGSDAAGFSSWDQTWYKHDTMIQLKQSELVFFTDD